MPYIDFNVTCEITPENEKVLKAGLGEAIALIPGKTESRLMIQFKDNCRLWFGGDNSTPIAFVNVMVFGAAAKESYKDFSDKAIALIKSELKIPDGNIYLKFEEVPNWLFG